MGKIAAYVAVLIFLALSSLTIAENILVKAVNEVVTEVFVSVPATVEAAQEISIKMWIEPAPPSPPDAFHDPVLTITSPDGVKNDYVAMRTEIGSYFFSYMINKLGNYTFQCSYPGETFADGTIKYMPSKSQLVILTSTGDAAPPVEISGGSWEQKQSMTQARGGLGVAAVNGKIYAIGGRVENDSYYSPNRITGLVGTNEEYNPATDTWTLKSPMPTPRSNFAIAACGNKIYCINSAIVGFKLDDIYHMFEVPIWSGVNEVYDPATDTWATKTPMPAAMSNAKANVVNGKIYIFDGSTNWVYDPASDSWSKKTSAPFGVGGYPSAALGNKIYVISNYSPLQIYDTSTDSWSQGARCPRLDPSGPTGVTTGVFAPERIYLFTVAQYGWVPYGKTGTSGFSRRTTFVYNPETDSWSAGAVIPELRVDFGIATVNDKLYAVGGYYWVNHQKDNVTVSGENEQYTPIGFGNSKPSSSSSAEDTHPYPVPETFQTALVVATSIASITAVACLLVYFKKRKVIGQSGQKISKK